MGEVAAPPDLVRRFDLSASAAVLNANLRASFRLTLVTTDALAALEAWVAYRAFAGRPGDVAICLAIAPVLAFTAWGPFDGWLPAFDGITLETEGIRFTHSRHPWKGRYMPWSSRRFYLRLQDARQLPNPSPNWSIIATRGFFTSWRLVTPKLVMPALVHNELLQALRSHGLQVRQTRDELIGEIHLIERTVTAA